jgi:hypothetical protein
VDRGLCRWVAPSLALRTPLHPHAPAPADISTASTPGKRTRAKIRYDDQFLYIGAEVTDDTIFANISSTCHCIDPTHDQVIYHDNDFEIFVDSDGSTHAYKETEVNAAAASWDLLLNKPYNDGGGENSSRVFGDAGFDMWPHGAPSASIASWPPRGAPQAGVATYVSGTLNNPGVAASYWTAEVRLPLADLVYNTTASLPVKAGAFWRINFSRVEWGVQVVNGAYWLAPSCTTCPVPGTAVEDNWVWSPQGSIAMHLPERWGFLQMADANVNATAPVVNPQWPSRQVAMALYYAQHSYAAGPGNGSYTDDISLLLPLTPDPGVIDGTCTKGLPSISLGPGAKTFSASAQQLDGRFTATVRDDRYLTVAGQ